MKSILITGCNRGIGLGLIEYLLKNYTNTNIFATCRNLEKAQVSLCSNLMTKIVN